MIRRASRLLKYCFQSTYSISVGVSGCKILSHLDLLAKYWKQCTCNLVFLFPSDRLRLAHDATIAFSPCGPQGQMSHVGCGKLKTPLLVPRPEVGTRDAFRFRASGGFGEGVLVLAVTNDQYFLSGALADYEFETVGAGIDRDERHRAIVVLS